MLGICVCVRECRGICPSTGRLVKGRECLGWQDRRWLMVDCVCASEGLADPLHFTCGGEVRSSRWWCPASSNITVQSSTSTSSTARIFTVSPNWPARSHQSEVCVRVAGRYCEFYRVHHSSQSDHHQLKRGGAQVQLSLHDNMMRSTASSQALMLQYLHACP
jgi:hypothetical protein